MHRDQQWVWPLYTGSTVMMSLNTDQLTLSMIVKESAIVKKPTNDSTTEPIKPGRPMPQNNDTEKYLEWKAGRNFKPTIYKVTSLPQDDAI